ncbi:TIGR04222 domain-containing membrane protein [Streptomyces sp. NPDC015131]|uniref:TIGR04222 domain-containing membrane protein n=1 Tax=Streptomyces sp. NPDC015131 TaxID=3364941 RepID=UPI0036F5FAAA
MSTLVLLVYLAVAVSSVLLVRGVVASRRGPRGSVHHRVEAAFLAGGPARVVDSALAQLQSDGRVTVGGPGIVRVVRPLANDPVESAVLHELAAAPSGALHTVRLAAMRHPAVQEIGDGLAARGLVVPRAAGRVWRRWSLFQVLGCFALLLGFIAITIVTFAGAEPDETPFPYIFAVVPALFAGALIAMICGAVAGRRITRAGRRALAVYRRATSFPAGAGDLVARDGLRAVPDPVFREQLVAAARMPGARGGRDGGGSDVAVTVVVWCASTDPGGSGCGAGCGGGGGNGAACSGGSSCGSSGGGGSGCGGGGSSSCGGGGGGGGD